MPFASASAPISARKHLRRAKRLRVELERAVAMASLCERANRLSEAQAWLTLALVQEALLDGLH